MGSYWDEPWMDELNEPRRGNSDDLGDPDGLGVFSGYDVHFANVIRGIRSSAFDSDVEEGHGDGSGNSIGSPDVDASGDDSISLFDNIDDDVLNNVVYDDDDSFSLFANGSEDSISSLGTFFEDSLRDSLESIFEGLAGDDDIDLSEARETRRLIESDDPSLVKLEVGSYGGYRPPDRDWKRVGQGIGGCSHLKELDVSGEAMASRDQRLFFRGIASNRSIRRLRLCQCDIDGQEEEIFSILRNNMLEHLVIDSCGLGSAGLGLLVSALWNFRSLAGFELSRCGMEDEVLRGLAGALTHHLGLREVTIRANHIGLGGCNMLAKAELDALCLVNSGIDDKQADLLASGLNWNSMKELDLGRNYCITQRGWRSIFAVLHAPGCRLEKLYLRGGRISDDSALILAASLSKNATLKSLDISENRGISIGGWRALTDLLQSPRCRLESLEMADNRLVDDMAVNLSSSLCNNRTLKRLSLQSNPAVSAPAWRRLTNALRSPSSGLEELDVRYNPSAPSVFASSLVNSHSKLVELLISYPVELNATFLQILCDDSSIMNTYHSNHTLQRICGDLDGDRVPAEVRSLLELNRRGKNQAARLKIIEHHFNEGFAAPPFVDMSVGLVPHAIAWMVRGGRSDVIDGHFYEFVRRECALIGN